MNQHLDEIRGVHSVEHLFLIFYSMFVAIWKILAVHQVLSSLNHQFQ